MGSGVKEPARPHSLAAVPGAHLAPCLWLCVSCVGVVPVFSVSASCFVPVSVALGGRQPLVGK
jgi:hypothetical protein